MNRKSLHVGAARLGALLSIPITVMGPGTAQAQERDAIPITAVEAGTSREQDHIVVGVGVAATPNYQGSEDYRILPIPVLDIKEGWFFANLRNGVGIEPFNTDTITIGASAVFVQGIRREDLPTGINKVSDAVGARVFANIRASGFVATLGATKLLGGTKGVIADASLSYPIQISSRFMLTPTISTTWADRKHNDRYFGVTAEESLASGLPQFTAGSGFKDISGSLTASYRLSDRITLSATGSVSSLLGEVQDSPLVEKTTQPFGGLTFTYRI